MPSSCHPSFLPSPCHLPSLILLLTLPSPSLLFPFLLSPPQARPFLSSPSFFPLLFSDQPSPFLLHSPPFPLFPTFLIFVLTLHLPISFLHDFQLTSDRPTTPTPVSHSCGHRSAPQPYGATSRDVTVYCVAKAASKLAMAVIALSRLRCTDSERYWLGISSCCTPRTLAKLAHIFDADPVTA